MKELNAQRVCEILNEIIELEMAGVVRYVYARPGPAISFAKKVMTGNVEIFGDDSE